jgi:hypothetical protein
MPTVKKVAASIRKFEKGFNNEARTFLADEGEKLLDYIRRTKFRRGRTFTGRDRLITTKSIVSRTGKLEKSLKAVTRFKRGGIVLEISMTGPQARILEEGGTTRPHVIRPKRLGGVLAFPWAAAGPGMFFFKKVNHPGSKFVARRIFERSFEERSSNLVKNIEKKMLKSWERRVGA